MEKEKLKELVVEHKEKFLTKTELVKREIHLSKTKGNHHNYRNKKRWQVLAYEINLR